MRGVLLVLVTVTVGCASEPPPSQPAPRDRPALVTRPADAEVVRACERASGKVAVGVLCPSRLPTGSFETPRDFGTAPCSYLLNLEPRGMGAEPRAAFHVLFGGTCRAWDMRTDANRWPRNPGAARAHGDLRLVGAMALTPGQTQADQRLVALEVLRQTRVGSARALVLRNPPYPAGGIHGGHITVVWNTNGAGYAVGGHLPRDEDVIDSERAEGLAATIAAVLETARSMRRTLQHDR